MKPLMVAAALALLGASGCATEGYVSRQIDPLNDRVGKLETKMAIMEAKAKTVEEMVTGASRELSPEDQAALREARELSRLAFEKACKVEADLKRAEDAVKDAEASTRKNQKMFELQQKK